MILDSLDNFNVYYKIHPLFERVHSLLSDPKLKGYEHGKHEFDGENIFFIVSKSEVKRPESIKLESHIKYLDVHFTISGKDVIGWRDVGSCEKKIGEFNVQDDYVLYEDESLTEVAINENHFVIVYPNDAHAPMIGEGYLHKIVVKVKV